MFATDFEVLQLHNFQHFRNDPCGPDIAGLLEELSSTLGSKLSPGKTFSKGCLSCLVVLKDFWMKRQMKVF